MSGPKLYLLDTNMAGFIANDRSPAARSMMEQVIKRDSVRISAIVAGELLYGLARKPHATRLRIAVEAILSIADVLPWDSAAARTFGTVRAQLASAGKPLATMDTLIAAHAVSVGAILVTHDGAFQQVQSLRVVDWATDL